MNTPIIENKFNHASLFSGIGGFELAAQWAGWENVFHCEINPFSQKVLKYHFPKSINYEDIIKTNFSIHKGTIDILTGGFPCQPYSNAGKRLGTADARHLWPQMLRAIQEIQPTWIVGENVRGLINWNRGLVFDEVQANLEAEGYEVTLFLLPACAVNAPHRRDRIWFVAYSQNNGRNQQRKEIDQWKINKFQNRDQVWDKFTTNGNKSNATNAYSIRLEGQRRAIKKLERDRGFSCSMSRNLQNTFWQNFPTQSPICGGNDGLPKQLDNITFSKWKQETIKAYGNAIVPQVAFKIFKAINEYNKL